MDKIENTDVILHAFDWPYALIEEEATTIAQLGYRSVLISPAMKSLSLPQGTPWWQRYQPQDYRVVDNQLGNLTALRSMITTLDSLGIHVYVDVVFNHMANESDIRHDLQYPNPDVLAQYQQDHDYYQAQRLFGDLTLPLFRDVDFVEAFSISDWRDKWQVQHGRLVGDENDPGLPTLKDNPHVVSQQRAYLVALKQLGVKGFRIDAAKHMTLEHLTQVWSADICEGMHIFAEIITDGGATKQEYQNFLEPYLAATPLAAYDFPLFQTLLQAFQPTGSLTSLVDPYSLGQALAESRAVTFAITHDIPNNAVFAGLVMEEEWEALAYIYLLGRDGGVPLIYSDLNTSGMEDKQGSPRWLEGWQSPAMRAMIQFHNLMHGCSMHVLQWGDDTLAFARGDKGLVLLNKSNKVQRFELSVEGEWRDILLKSRCEREELLVVEVSPRSGAMLVPAVS